MPHNAIDDRPFAGDSQKMGIMVIGYKVGER